MQLDSVRELKIKAQEKICDNIGLLESTSPGIQNYPPGLGICSTSNGNDYKLAVHLSDKSLLNFIKDEIIPLSKEEVHITITGNVYLEIGSMMPNDPLSIGRSISRCDEPKNSGTLGCFVKKRNEEGIFILSCNHVLAKTNRGRRGDLIVSPVREDNNNYTNESIAILDEFIELQDTNNIADAAIAKVNNINEIERLCPFYNHNLFMPFFQNSENSEQSVSKVGSSTGLTIGKLTIFEMTRIFPYPDQISRQFPNLMAVESHISNRFSNKGDSGSILIDIEGCPQGLLIGGAYNETTGKVITYASPIDPVYEKLEIELAHL